MREIVWKDSWELKIRIRSAMEMGRWMVGRGAGAFSLWCMPEGLLAEVVAVDKN